MNSHPDAIQRAEHQLEMLLKPGGSGGAFCLQEELEICWESLKADSTVPTPEAKMYELAEWFSGKVKEAIRQQISQSPAEGSQSIPPIESPRITFAWGFEPADSADVPELWLDEVPVFRYELGRVTSESNETELEDLSFKKTIYAAWVEAGTPTAAIDE